MEASISPADQKETRSGSRSQPGSPLRYSSLPLVLKLQLSLSTTKTYERATHECPRISTFWHRALGWFVLNRAAGRKPFEQNGILHGVWHSLCTCICRTGQLTQGAIIRMNRRRRLLILMIVLAIAIPVGLDSMGKVFAGAGVGLSNPTQPGTDSGNAGNWDRGLLNAARHFLTHKQIPPDNNSLGENSDGKRFQEANNNLNGHSYAPWLDGGFPAQLWHSDEFSSSGLPGGSPEGGNPPNGNAGGDGNGGGNSGGSPGFGGPIGGGTILPGGPNNGKNSDQNNSDSTTTGFTDTPGSNPTATPEPGSLLLFATGILLIAVGSRLRRSWLPQA